METRETVAAYQSPWHDDAIAREATDGPYADYAAWAAWMGRQSMPNIQDGLACILDDLDYDQKIALYCAFHAACEAAALPTPDAIIGGGGDAVSTLH
jgi:hypothetical protein